MRPDLFKEGKFSFRSVFISKTILPFYGSIILLLITVYLLLTLYRT
jgi:hypothetical protein